MHEWFNWIEKLKKEGRYDSGEPLEPVGKGVKRLKNLLLMVLLPEERN